MKSWRCDRKTPSGGFRLYANQDEGVHAGQGIVPVDTNKVRVDGEETTIHITDQSIMFENEGRVSGFERSVIRMAKPDGDAMIIAYAVGSEVKSVRVEPLTAVASLVASGAQPALAGASITGQVAIFEKLYHGARKELEERLAIVEADPENQALRLTPEERQKYISVRNQMTDLVRVRFGVSHDEEEPLLTFWGLENREQEYQICIIKTMHIDFLLGIVSPKAETEDVGYQARQVWPQDWPKILERFNLGNESYRNEKFSNLINYLKSHWEYHPGLRRPVLVS